MKRWKQRNLKENIKSSMLLNRIRNHLARIGVKRGEVFRVQQQRRISSFQQCIYNNHNQDHRSCLKNMKNQKGNKKLHKLGYLRHSNNLFLDINSSSNSNTMCIRSRNNLINNNRSNSSLIKISRLETHIKMQYQLGQII